MKKIKVAQVITRLDWGGSPDIFRILCSLLDPQVFDVQIITGPTEHPSKKTAAFLEKFSGRVTVLPHLKRNIDPAKDVVTLIQMYRLFRKERFDIVHTHTAKAGALGRLAAWICKVPAIVHTPHGHTFYGYFNPVLNRALITVEKLLARITGRIIALTELEKNDFLRYKVGTPEKIAVIYQGLELEVFFTAGADKARIRKELGIAPDDFVVGMIGRLEPIKGIHYLIQGAREILKESGKVKFIVCGEGSLRQNLTRDCFERGLADKFIFTGWRENTREILSLFDVLVLPSLNEAVGMVLIEAQACGIPVVATRVGGIPEVVKDNQSGILVEARDSLSLAKAIRRLVKDASLRQTMGAWGREWVKGKFSAKEMADKTTQLYTGLLKT